jgi:tetratricopeptide (TPR) repeat protein
LRKAISLNPSFALAHAYLGFALGVGGRPKAGLEALDRATRLSPRDPFLASDAIFIRNMTEFAAGHYEEVIRLSRLLLRDRPNMIGAYRFAAAAYGLLGRIDEAQAALSEVLRLDPDFRSENVERVSVYSDPRTRARYIEGLRNAGLPE